MRIKYGEYISEVETVWVRETDISIGACFYLTGEDTEKIGEQILKQGYADLSKYKRR